MTPHAEQRGPFPAFPYPLIDRVLEVEPGVRAVGSKLVSANEPYFVGHFPGAPVLPGVLVCEALVQLGAYLDEDAEDLRLLTVDRARFRRPAVPGDALRLEVTRRAPGSPSQLRGVVSVGTALVAEVDFSAARPAGPRIHPTAVVAGGAELGADVTIGPYAVIGRHVRMGAGCRIGPHAVVDGHTTLGAGTRIFPFASVGSIPQDLKYRGEPSTLELGEANIVRETGRGCLFMVNAHVGHDCRLGDHVIVSPGAALGGHVTVEDHAIIGGLVGVHQFVRIGESALCAAGAMVSMDVPPYCVAAGDRARLHGLNVVGLRRRGFTPAALATLKRAYRMLFQAPGTRRDAVTRTREALGHVPEVARLLEFVQASQRGVCR
ncbi:MAG: acyl-ACP--UDP-N-acetylglucosamine O-acyltransferase [Deltaproteobacteria bacterium]|nr:MAG: acyl-ACP--UDP-N-acetylglucosamine O-acyltransferase [Deltaproteobacteria bacterium]